MNHYQTLTILPDPELSPYFIWSKLFTQVHLALVEHAKATYGEAATHGDIGISFPDYRFAQAKDKQVSTLGRQLRVFASSADQLDQLNLGKWLDRLTDYVHVKSPNSVPNEHSYITVSRARQVKNLDQITKRRARRKGESFEEAKDNIIKRYAKTEKIDIAKAKQAYENPTLKAYPYINMKSLRGSNRFSLELKQTDAKEAVVGKFNTYGLSSTTTVPHW